MKTEIELISFVTVMNTRICFLPFENCRGYAFVRFGEQGDQMRALQDCQNAPGLGGKRIRLSIGISKR